VWTDLSAEMVDELFAGNLYLNFHTTAFPGGEIRGQIVPTPGAAGVLAGAALMGLRRRRHA
ncbi:MAG: CHRD domain-containing protein, partial [Phycisphaerales bacterium]